MGRVDSVCAPKVNEVCSSREVVDERPAGLELIQRECHALNATAEVGVGGFSTQLPCPTIDDATEVKPCRYQRDGSAGHPLNLLDESNGVRR
jgi:hypothetical protein